jgi:hypothetical protein
MSGTNIWRPARRPSSPGKINGAASIGKYGWDGDGIVKR